MINRFIADLKIESTMAPHNYNRENSAVLDLSRRRDSVETRKTPSPYNSSSNASAASPKANLEQNQHHQSSSPKQLSEHSPLVYPIPTYLQDAGLQHGHQPLSMYYYHRQQSGLAPAPLQRQHDQPSIQHHQKSPRSLEHPFPEDQPSSHTYPFDALKTATVLQQQLQSRTSSIQLQSGAGANRESPKSEQVKSPVPSINPATNPLPSLIYPKLINRDGKVPRPFKAYPRDPLAMAATFTATDALLDTQKAEKYSAFRKRMLEQIHASNGGRPTITNPKMRRNGINSRPYQEEHANDSSSGNEELTSGGSVDLCNNNNNNSSSVNQNGIVKDQAYYERRKKNNAAAKKSRDRRRIKEDEIAVRAAFLEHENIELRIELAALKNQLALLTANSSR